jgi:hypothetical protein
MADATTFYVEPDTEKPIQVEIGDSKSLQFEPQAKIIRDNNRVNLSVRVLVNEDAPDVSKEGDVVVAEYENQRIDFYQIPPCLAHPEGANEIEQTLFEKPASNVQAFSIRSKGIRFEYQAALTDEDRKKPGGIRYRPDHVVGSYVLFDENLDKVGHWFRPRIIDAEGKGVWGELNIDAGAGIGSVTIPQEFLDNAVYPVRHAIGATIGYTSGGASSNSWSDYIVAHLVTTGGTGYPVKDYQRYTAGSASSHVCGIYSSDGSSRIDQSVSYGGGIVTGWIARNSANNNNLSASTNYLIAINPNSSSAGTLWYDSVGGYTVYYKSSAYTGSMPSSMTGYSTYTGEKYSFYVNYEDLSGQPAMRRWGGVPGMGQGQSFAGRGW